LITNNGGHGELHMVVDPRHDRGEHVRLKAGGIEQVILKQLAGLVGFGKHLQRQVGMWSIGQLNQPILKRPGQMDDIPAPGNRSPVGRGIRIGMAWWRWLLRPRDPGAKDGRKHCHG
jgi:hypothetical protein